MPLLPIPTARQLEWQTDEMTMFVHFTVNTYTNREWGDGSEDPQIFNPVELDARQWVRAAKKAGFKTMILTAKHHDGFCLWPSRYTEHSVKNSPWRDGKGDVIHELQKACQAEGLKMGLYLSPWDRHEPTYGQGLYYNQYYLGQLRELLTLYGSLSEIWFDGACGEGPNGKKQQYDFDAYWSLVRQLQPGAVMFSDAGPDVRWIGNEHGFAGETCWSMMDKDKVTIGGADTGYLNTGDPNGPHWVPGECDVSIRKGWFWHPDQQPKTVEQLVEIYFKSVGRNGVFLLNVPPNRKGLFSQEDVQRLYEFRAALNSIFKNNLAYRKTAKASTVRGGALEYSAANVLDEDDLTYWATDDDVTTGSIEVDLGEPVTFNVARMQEPITFGQRIAAYHIDVWDGDAWKTISKGTTIGYTKLDRFNTVTAQRVRLVIDNSRACPLVSEFGLFFNPMQE